MRGNDTYDHKNMTRVMNYIQGTIGLPLILSINNSVNIKCYTYEAFAVHKYISSHNGGFITVGTGGDYVQSRKNNLNTKISTKAEIVGVDDLLTQIMWTQYFLK